MSASIPGEDSTLGQRLLFAIEEERHRGITAVQNALMLKHPDVFRHRGFMSSYTSGRRGKWPDPRLLKLIADYLHVSFEWLMLGSGPFRRDGRSAATPFEEAIFIARDWGLRSDAAEIAWEQNKHRADTLTPMECFDAIRMEASRLDRERVPRPEAAIATRDKKESVLRIKRKIAKQRTAATTPAQQVPAPKRRASGRRE